MKLSFAMTHSHCRRILPYSIYLPVLVLLWSNAFAQCPVASQLGTQWVDGSFGIIGTEVGTQCTSRAVTVTTPATVTKARYVYDYKTIADTSKAVSQTTNLYTQPGSYYIVQLGTVNGKPSIFCNLIQVYATAKPTFTATSDCGNSTKVKINTAGLIYGRYLVDWGDGKPTQVYTPGQPDLSYVYANPGSYQIKVRGEGTLALLGCNADSDPKPIEVLAAPAPISGAVATIRGDAYGEVRMTVPNTVKVKHFSYVKNGSEFIRTTNVYIDSTLIPAQSSACYQVYYTDICDQKPTSTPTVCTIHLKMEGEMLKWSSESPFTSAVNTYTVEKLHENGQVIETYPVATLNEWLIDPTDTDADVIYRIRATAADGQTSISNTIRFGRSPNLFVPDTFSPNNDLNNDTFDLKGQSIEKGEVFIYDRWGNVLFHTTDWTKGWDGTDANGRNVPPGFYTYRIEYADTQKNAYTKRGTVSLLR